MSLLSSSFASSPLVKAAASHMPKGGHSSFAGASRSNTLSGIYNALEGGSGPSMPTPPKTASPTPPSSSTSNNAPGSGAAPPPAFDLNADPVLQQVQAQMASANSMAQSGALS